MYRKDVWKCIEKLVLQNHIKIGPQGKGKSCKSLQIRKFLPESTSPIKLELVQV